MYKTTNWDRYHSSPHPLAALSRKISRQWLLKAIRTHLPDPGNGLVVAELGGGNSSFYQDIVSALRPAQYHILDDNRPSLELLRPRFHPQTETVLHEQNLLSFEPDWRADLVFSAGLVEHFAPEDTAKIIQAHLRLLKPQSLLLIAFPSPTWLYTLTRNLLEAAGCWIFHDERPLRPGEVEQTLPRQQFEVLSCRLIPLMLTQYLLAARPIIPLP